jgi:hypothetical protein
MLDMSKDIEVKMIKPEFLDFVNYNICKAYSEKYGKAKAEDFFKRVGEIGFNELRKLIEFPSEEPYDVLKTVADFLEDMGYMTKINLTNVGENEVVIEMYGVSVNNSSIRLTDEGNSPSHFMTNLMFSALREISNVEAEIEDLVLELATAKTGYTMEKWTIKRK